MINIDTLYKKLFLITVLILTGVLTSHPIYSQTSKLDWRSFEDAMTLAENDQKPILIDVWAPWCGWCKKMQKEVYPQLSEILESDFILTRLNRDDNDTRKKYRQYSHTPLRLAQKFNVLNVPAVVILSPEGEYLFHVSGFMEVDELEEVLGYVTSERARKSFR